MEPWFCHWHKRRSRVVFQALRRTVNPRVGLALMASLYLLLSNLFAIAQTQTQLSSGVVERGQDYAVYRRVSAVTEATGAVTAQTNQFTLLENCLNYFDDGQWKESEDLIETTKEGAIAQRGPN